MPGLGPSASQGSRGFQLRIDTSVPSTSLNIPSSPSTWQSPSPNTPALVHSAATGSSLNAITPASASPWSISSPLWRRHSDIDAQGYENSVYSGEPRESKPWSLKRMGSAFRSTRKLGIIQTADPHLSDLTTSVITHGLDDWSLVEAVCRSATTHAANADCVLKAMVRQLITGNGFQQLSAARLWAILMKRDNPIIVFQCAQPEFLKSLERIIVSPAIEMVAVDRLVAVLATAIHDKWSQSEAESYRQLWSRIALRKRLDPTPLCSDDAIYGPGSLIPPRCGPAREDVTLAVPYTAPPVIMAPEQHEDPNPKVKAGPPTIRVTHPTRSGPARDSMEQPPPYSPCSPSEPGPSVLNRSVVDTYPFAKGYATDIGPDIDIASIEANPFDRGAFGDVRRATLRNGTRVAIKCLRFYTSARDTGRHRLEKKSLKEIRVWSFLDHENVLPLIGLCVINSELGMVSEFMPNGNVQEYIQKNPTVDRFKLAADICAGLVYLHEHPKRVIHGDLKAVNVVVDINGIPKLTDFGLAQMVRAEDSMERSSSSSVGGTARWMAYEQLCPTAPETACRPNTQSDVHSLGMEVFSGKLPFAEFRSEPRVIRAIMDGALPTRTSDFSEPLWELLNDCWNRVPHERPTARQVRNRLLSLAREGDS
ncbi:Serine/threonine-protein kinase [Ceratobasidium sp. AG-Ba]|nr:Serine/threonine-protein kinase [Ceratobasidium sp. AG-Ba]